MNYHKMVKDIDKLVNNDFVFGLECKLIPEHEEFTQEESKKMLDIILNVYKISHSENCIACRDDKYLK